MAKATVTEQERLQLIALFTLARKHTALLQQIRDAANLLTGDEEEFGRTADGVHEDNDPVAEADNVLSDMGIAIHMGR